MFLKDWAERLDAFLTFNERDVLTGAGCISKKQTDAHAENQYEQFSAQRRALLEAGRCGCQCASGGRYGKAPPAGQK